MEIAVLVNSEGNTSGFEKDGEIRVYAREQCQWSITRSMEYRLENAENSGSLHEKIREICDWLADCRIIVVRRIRGVHYIAFEKAQISMLEINGAPETFLEDVGECLRHKRTGQKVPMEHNAIFELRSGVYHTDLREVMKGNTSYSSRQILFPFLKSRQYTSLEILCDHVPKWLEKEQLDLNLRISIENYKTCMKVKVYPVKK